MKCKVGELWHLLEDRTLIDVRSPGEFSHGHIPFAHNLPLFTDEERAFIGTTYKQNSPRTALLKGLDIVGPKMSGFVKKAEKLAVNRKVLIHCWRGGKRSESMAWLLSTSGFDVLTLEGGYKSYRNFLYHEFAASGLKLIVLGGQTGCGKTRILHELRNAGEQIIDLEAIAHHKGSAFGWIGEAPQPSVEQFENNLFEKIRELSKEKRTWIENESRSIGMVYVPDSFWQFMRTSTLFNIQIPREERIRHLVEVYTGLSKEALLLSFQKIEKKLGGRMKEARESLERDDYHEAASIALQYYDKTYLHGLENSVSRQIFNHNFEKLEPQDIALQLIHFADQHHL